MGKDFDLKRRQRFVDCERRSFDAFLDEIEIANCYPENVDLAKKIIDVFNQKFNLNF